MLLESDSIVSGIRDSAHLLSAEIRRVRRHLHRHPELSGQEYQTTEFLAARTRELGLTPFYADDKRGLWVDIGNPDCRRRLLVRVDIDALPIQTELTTEYASSKAGAMHACGHDAHAAVGFGAAALINEFSGQLGDLGVRVVFQPEEETSRGGRHVIRSGVLEGVDVAISLHVDPSLPSGTVGYRHGVLTAGCDVFECELSGRGGHGARPHLTGDLIGAASQWVSDVYRRVPRTTDPREAVVVNVGSFHSGNASNVVPSQALLTGTLRSLSADGRERAQQTMRSTSTAVASTHDCSVRLDFGTYTPPLINDSTMTSSVVESAVLVLGDDAVQAIEHPSMGAEDFAFIAANVPSAMFRLGVAQRDGVEKRLHTPTFDLDESALQVGAAIIALTALRWSRGFGSRKG